MRDCVSRTVEMSNEPERNIKTMTPLQSIQAHFRDEQEKIARSITAASEEGPCESAAPVGLVGSGSVVVLPAVNELSKSVRRRVEALAQADWTEDDWRDLLFAQRIVAHNVAARHGLLEQHNGASQTAAPKTSQPKS